MLIRYIYETIANWKSQRFFVEDYKLPSERYSQHVCRAAIGLYGGVGDIVTGSKLTETIVYPMVDVHLRSTVTTACSARTAKKASWRRPRAM